MTRHVRETPQFFLTSPTPCPYLPGQQERKVFTHLVGESAAELNDILTQGGFRRSQSIAYRPACEICRACVSVRVSIKEFQPDRDFRRIVTRNGDLIGARVANSASSEHYALFRDYLDARHADGGMAMMSMADFRLMVEDSHVETSLIEYRRRSPDSGFTHRGAGPLLGLCLTDVMRDGLSMVYSCYANGEERRSLGTFMILDHIARARALGLDYLYLGYWVEGSRKMAYKARFRPQERLMPEGWRRYE
ncbi:MAG: arginyltransferase [Bosea sp. (in: a-proteobacteria)]